MTQLSHYLNQYAHKAISLVPIVGSAAVAKLDCDKRVAQLEQQVRLHRRIVNQIKARLEKRVVVKKGRTRPLSIDCQRRLADSLMRYKRALEFLEMQLQVERRGRVTDIAVEILGNCLYLASPGMGVVASSAGAMLSSSVRSSMQPIAPLKKIALVVRDTLTAAALAYAGCQFNRIGQISSQVFGSPTPPQP